MLSVCLNAIFFSYIFNLLTRKRICILREKKTDNEKKKEEIYSFLFLFLVSMILKMIDR